MAVFHDVVQGAGPTDVDLANRTQIGSDLELSGQGTILSISAIVTNVGTVTQAKPVVGYITVESKQINIEPFKFPFPPTSSHLGSTPHTYVEPPDEWIVNCPFGIGTKLSIYCTLGVAAPVGAPEVSVTVTYTDGGGTGSQVHMEVVEPSAALGTADNTRTVLTALELPGAQKLILIWVYVDVATGVADEAVCTNIEISSNQWAVSGPCAFGVRQIPAHDATTGWGGSGITKRVTDRDFKSNQVVKVTCALTQYDANNAAPEAYVGFAYI